MISQVSKFYYRGYELFMVDKVYVWEVELLFGQRYVLFARLN